MEVTDLIAPDRVIVGFNASSKPHLLAELARRAAAVTGVPQKQIGDVLEARENLGSTGVGSGIAIPHAQLAALNRFFGLFIRLDRPIDYNAIDGRPVDLIFLLLIPGSTRDHLKALAAISRRLRDQKVANDLRAATTATETYTALTKTL